jgi:NADH-quinone oxidoreductase subunit N
MTAPFLWIILPLILAGVLWPVRNYRIVMLLGGALVFLLATTAWLLPIETAMTLGSISIKLGSSIEILGRRLVLTSSDQPFLALIYGSFFFWLIASLAVKINHHLILLGLAITALLVASIAVDPFLYAALLIEMAVLLAIPFLAPGGQKPGKGLLRFLIFQTLGMPFILFSGWLLAGIEANPGNLAMILQAAILLGMGFAFLLAIFPFYTWIPLLAEEAPPFAVGFILWMFPTTVIVFGLGFIDRYTWLRVSPDLTLLFDVVGILMVATGGLLAAFQQHLGRIMGYAAIMETGFSLLSLALSEKIGLNIFYLLFVPRVLSLIVWSLALTICRQKVPSLAFNDVKGIGRSEPLAASSLVLANLSIAGIPLLAGFPIRQALWGEISRQSLPMVIWIFLGSLCLFIAAIRTLIVLASAPEGTPWSTQETWMQRIFMGIGWLAFVLLGLFPQWMLVLWTRLPALFSHLGQ